MKNWLEGIEQQDNDKELVSNNDDLKWLAAENETSINYLEGIKKLETADIRLLKQFNDKGILEILKKKASNKQLLQPELNILKEFRQIFPDMTIEE